MKMIKAKSILSGKNNMNIYRGCTHGCIYCDSRSNCYGMTYTFEDVEVKENAPELLEDALGKKRSKCMITTGAMTDPYLPLEQDLGIMRSCLEIIHRHGFGVAVLTKSNLVRRDLDLLQSINKQTKAVVQMTMTTYDEDLCKILEPNVTSTMDRYIVLKECQALGIPTVVWLTPTLPFINDNKENLDGILEYCKDAGVKGILTFGAGMTLRYGNREYYFTQLDKHFPGLKQKYMRTFGTSYGCKSPNAEILTKQVKSFCKANDILTGTKKVFDYISEFESREKQLNLFDKL